MKRGCPFGLKKQYHGEKAYAKGDLDAINGLARLIGMAQA